MGYCNQFFFFSLLQASDLSYLKKSFTFKSALQAQYFVQRVGIFCTQKDHHPEWSITDGGKTVNVKLTSHFANNKATLFDFQIAEHMNQQSQVTTKWFREHQFFSEKSWSSFKIFLVSFVLFNFSLQLGYHWGNLHPSASQRGQVPQSAQYRPLMINDYEFFSGGIHSEKEVELYAKAFVDDYAFKKRLFSSRNMW